MMTKTALLLLGVLAGTWPATAERFGAEESGCEGFDKLRNSSSVPQRFWRLLAESGIRDKWEPDVCRLNPWYLIGDFDGDGRYDYAVPLRPVAGRGIGRLAVLWHKGGVAWLDKDEELRYPDPGAWHVHPRHEPVPRNHFDERDPPELVGDGIVTHRLEASSALIYWNGVRFTDYWVGD